MHLYLDLSALYGPNSFSNMFSHTRSRIAPLGKSFSCHLPTLRFRVKFRWLLAAFGSILASVKQSSQARKFGGSKNGGFSG